MLEQENLMSTYSPANEKYLEIAGVGTSFPRQSRWMSVDGTVEYWSLDEVVPDVAQKLIAAVATSLRRQFDVNPTALRIRTRVSASTLLGGHYDTRATLLYSPQDEAANQVDGMRSVAARLLAAVRQPITSRSNGTAAFLGTEEVPFPIDSLLESPVAPLLGTRITDDLVAHVPGRPLLELKHKFRDAPQLPSASETFEVRGRLSATKSAGRFRSVSIAAFRTGNWAEFKQAKVLVTDELRESIARAVREPSRRLRMIVTRSEVYMGRAAPRVAYTLKDLRFDDATQA
jgi:hypothetical protein